MEDIIGIGKFVFDQESACVIRERRSYAEALFVEHQSVPAGKLASVLVFVGISQLCA